MYLSQLTSYASVAHVLIMLKKYACLKHASICSIYNTIPVSSPRGVGGYCHVWALLLCAAVRGMVFKQFTVG